MGFAIGFAQSVAAILIIAIIGRFVYTEMILQQDKVTETKEEFKIKQSKEDSSLTLINASYNGTLQSVIIDIQNSGNEKFQLSEVDIYRDAIRYGRNHANISKTFVLDLSNPDIVDNKDIFRINHSTILNPGQHIYTVTTPLGIDMQIPITAQPSQQEEIDI